MLINSFRKMIFIVLASLIFVALLVAISDKQPYLKAPNGRIILEVVNTEDLRQKGLSGRDDIGQSEGMLFEFTDSSVDRCFWMKDMKFAIDIVWISELKKVVHVEENVAPETYPESFCPDEPARYVLETKAGRASQLGADYNGVELQF